MKSLFHSISLESAFVKHWYLFFQSAHLFQLDSVVGTSRQRGFRHYENPHYESHGHGVGVGKSSLLAEVRRQGRKRQRRALDRGD
jgi:hypothetical protein